MPESARTYVLLSASVLRDASQKVYAEWAETKSEAASDREVHMVKNFFFLLTQLLPIFDKDSFKTDDPCQKGEKLLVHRIGVQLYEPCQDKTKGLLKSVQCRLSTFPYMMCMYHKFPLSKYLPEYYKLAEEQVRIFSEYVHEMWTPDFLDKMSSLSSVKPCSHFVKDENFRPVFCGWIVRRPDGTPSQTMYKVMPHQKDLFATWVHNYNSFCLALQKANGKDLPTEKPAKAKFISKPSGYMKNLNGVPVKNQVLYHFQQFTWNDLVITRMAEEEVWPLPMFVFLVLDAYQQMTQGDDPVKILLEAEASATRYSASERLQALDGSGWQSVPS